jgi:hypothetical protein
LPDPRKIVDGVAPFTASVTVLLVVGAATNRLTIDPLASVNPEMAQLSELGALALDAVQIPGPLTPVPPLNAAHVLAATHP